MGLLERALQYKQRINETGKETLIDRIKGPAENDNKEEINIKKINIDEIDSLNQSISDKSNEFKNEIIKADNKIYEEINLIKKEEDIILFDEDDFQETKTEEIRQNDETIIKNSVEKKIAELSSFDKKGNEKNFQINKENILTDINGDSVKEESSVHDTGNIEAEIKENEMPEFNDFGTLFEIQKEFIKADTIEEVYSTILFSIMGQVGVSSVSIIASSPDDLKKWIIIDSHGIKISDNDIYWEIDNGILKILDTYKGVLDIEDLKNDNNLRDDYYKFTAVDARIIAPLMNEDKLVGAILVGEKINSEQFTMIELDFLQALSDISSSIIESLVLHERTSTELLGLRIEKEILSDVELFQNSLLNVSSINELEEVIRKNFYSLGLENYTIFMEDKIGSDYYPAYFEKEDMLGFSDSGFKIKKDNRLITFLINKKTSIILEGFNESSVIIDTFGRNRIVKMELFIAYPFLMSGKLSGFITIYKINSAVEIKDIDIRIQKINQFLFTYLYRVYELDPELNKYNDLTGMFYERIDSEIKHADEMNIPVSLVLLTIKNYKRFHDRFGQIELEKLFINIAEIIKSKLNAGDFAVKIDRSRFVIVLPGKEKRYSVMISNTIKNEIMEKYNTSDFKLLITSLNSVFPDDGKDLFSIMEVLE